MGRQLASDLMAGIIDQLQQQATRDENAGIALAAKEATWANQFNSIPTTEKLRANLDLNNAIATAIRRKQELSLADQEKLLDIKMKTAAFDQLQQINPLKEKLLQAQVEATGASERRRALEATTKAEHTSRINTGMLKLYQSGTQPGTPEWRTQAVEILASNPFGDIKDISELGKLAGFSDELSPEQYVAEAVKIKKAAADAGLSNPTIKSFSGRPTVVEGAAVITPEQSIENAVKRKKALQAVDPPKPVKKETFKEWSEEKKAAIEAYGGDEAKVPKDILDALEKRKDVIGRPAPSGDAKPVGHPDRKEELAPGRIYVGDGKFVEKPATVAAGPVAEAQTDTPGKLLAEVARTKSVARNVDRLTAAGIQVSDAGNGQVALTFNQPVAFDNPDDLKASWAIIPSGAIFIDPQGVKRRKP